MPFKSKFILEMTERDYFHQCTNVDGLDNLLIQQPISGYIGFDCTADSLHVGSLVQIMMLRHLQKSGNKPLVLMGGGTTKIGDPSGKDEARPLLSDQEIKKNKKSIQKIFEKYLIFGDGPTDAIIIDNLDWLNDLEYIKFLRDYGTHFSVNRMLSMDSVKLRLEREQNLSFLEFNYAILQAYDFFELRRRYGCNLQLGGSDQWGNIVSGVELVRRVDSQEVFGMTTPLITTSSGSKMGKTASGAIWLDDSKLSSYNFWQFWRNTEDKDVIKFLKLFTELPLSKIDELNNLKGNEINEAKIILANEVTSLCHGRNESKKCEEIAKQTFHEKKLSENLPSILISKEELNNYYIIDAFLKSGLANTKGEVRRLIRGGGAKLNDKTFTEEEKILSSNDFNTKGLAKISFGKKRHAIIELQ